MEVNKPTTGIPKDCYDTNKVYSFIGLARKAGSVVLGESLAEQAVRKRRAILVITTTDVSGNTKKKIESALFGTDIPLLQFGTKEELGRRLGKFYISVIAITDKGFAGKIKEMIEKCISKNNNIHGGGIIE